MEVGKEKLPEEDIRLLLGVFLPKVIRPGKINSQANILSDQDMANSFLVSINGVW